MVKFKKCILTGVKYKGHSTMGNPSYWVFFRDTQEGNLHAAYTSSNSSAGYTISNYSHAVGGVIYLEYHYTRKGNCIITRIKHNTPKEAEAME